MTLSTIEQNIVDALTLIGAETIDQDGWWFLELDEEQCETLWKFHKETNKCNFGFWREIDKEKGNKCEGHWDNYFYNNKNPYTHGNNTRLLYNPNSDIDKINIFELYDCTAGYGPNVKGEINKSYYDKTLIFYSNNLEEIYDLLKYLI